MKAKLAWLLVLLVVIGAAIGGCSGQKVHAAGKVVRRDVQLTIYKDDFGMVREVRPVSLAAGKNQIAIEEVSKVLDPRSVLFNWRGNNDLPALVANTFDVGIGDGRALIKRYVGQDVEIVRYGDNGRQSESQKGKLMAAEDGGIVLQTDDSFYVNPQGTIVAPAQQGIVTIPRLSVVAESRSNVNADLEFAYLTRGLSWTADYVGIVNPKAGTLVLQCWATVDNRAGIDFPDAKITLVAGSPNRAVRAESGAHKDPNLAETPAFYARLRSDQARLPSAPVGEMQSYEVKSKNTIMQSQLNRLMLLESGRVSMQQDYSVRMPSLAKWDYYYEWPSDSSGNQKVTVGFTFFNRSKDGLGDALPGGSIRLYESDDSGAVQYVGAAEIADTPTDQKISFTLSNVFNVTATNRIVSVRKAGRAITKTAEVTLQNRKDAPVELRVVQGLDGVWNLVTESAKSSKLNARTLQWNVTVPAKGEAKVRYSVKFA